MAVGYRQTVGLRAAAIAAIAAALVRVSSIAVIAVGPPLAIDLSSIAVIAVRPPLANGLVGSVDGQSHLFRVRIRRRQRFSVKHEVRLQCAAAYHAEEDAPLAVQRARVATAAYVRVPAGSRSEV